jgi:hypothetical protein
MNDRRVRGSLPATIDGAPFKPSFGLSGIRECFLAGKGRIVGDFENTIPVPDWNPPE